MRFGNVFKNTKCHSERSEESLTSARSLVLFAVVTVIFFFCIGQSALAEEGKIIGWGNQIVGVDLSGGFTAVAAAVI